MSCPKCGAPTERRIECPGVLSVVCICGHRTTYYKRDNGEWESEIQRRERMKVTVVCSDCHKEFDIPCPSAVDRKVCPTCSNKQNIITIRTLTEIRKSARNKNCSKNSPWRIGFFNKKPKGDIA